METNDREKTLTWLSCSSFEPELREFARDWLPGTCQWMNSHHEYLRWEDPSADTPQALWIFGNLGCGKTFLSHFIRQRLSREGVVIYYYFNSKEGDSGKQSANVFYRTIIYQLLKALEGTAISADCYSIAHELRRGTGANSSITNENLVNTLKDILMRIGTRVTIVIDALDECKEDDQDLVERSVSLCQDVQSLKIVITSRPEPNIVDRCKKMSSKINTQLSFSKTESSQDINLYIEQRLQNSKTLSDEMFPAMTQEIRGKLRKNAGGMFLYVKLMLDMLERQATEQGIRNGLESLPETLAGTYHTIIQKIEQNASVDFGETAKRILLWVTAAQLPLTLDGLMMALRAENLRTKENPTISDLGPFIPNYRERLWQICFPLLEVLEDNTVQLVHGSLRQYLLCGKIMGHGPVAATRGGYHYVRFVTPAVHIEIAHTCVAYLHAHKMTPVSSPLAESDGNAKNIEDVRKDFFVYATLEWIRHYQASGDRFDLLELNNRLLKYFGVHDQLKGWIEDRAAFDDRFAIYFGLEIGSGVLTTGNLPQLIHICAYFGLDALSSELLHKSSGDINLKDTTGRTPLHIAGERNWAVLVDNYIDKAQIHRNYYGGMPEYKDSKDNSGKTALHRAAAKGNRLPVLSLLKAGFSPNSPDNLGQTPLLLGALSGDFVLELCDAGGLLDSTSKSGLTPLDYLIMHGHEEALKGLLLSGRVPEDLPTSANLAFITAARKGFRGVIDLLLHAKINVNVNARDDIHQTALHRAATWGHIEVVELLLRQEWGADVDAVDQSHRTPLYFAAAGGHITIVQCLIQAGAKVNIHDRHGQAVLFEPAGRGHTAVVKELLGAGVEAKQFDHRNRSALHWASRGGHTEVVQLLLNAGADLHGEEWKKETPLHWAAQSGQDMMIEQLINAGAEPEPRDEQGRTPLHHGAWRAMQASVYTLLKYTSSPDVVDQNGYTPLYWGVVSGDSGVVETLLGAKANITAGETQNVTPLHIAAQYGHDDILGRFLDTGPNLEARDNKNKTALHFAAQEGNHNAIQLLLDAGASPIAVDFKRRTPTLNQSKKRDKSDRMSSVLNEAKENAEREYLSQLPSLHQAARNGDDLTVRNLIALGRSVNEKDARGRLALHWAALRGHEAIFLCLLSAAAGANIQFSDDSGQTALHVAVENRQPEIVKQCLLAGADVMIKDTCGRIPLHLAVEKEHEGIITQLLELPGSPECVIVVDNWSRTPLHFAAESGSNQVLANLLACGASTINSGDYKGQTPLHRAARKGYRDVVWGLQGAKLHVTDSNKRTALHLAAKYGHTNIVQQFIYEKDIIDAVDKDNRTALHLAAEKGYSAVVEHLLYAEDIYINARDKDNRTALDLAAENGLNSTPEVDTKDSGYIRPLHRMAEKGPASVVKCLLDAGATVCTQDNLERTPLHLAVQSGHKEIVDVLVDAKAMVDARDYWQKTPLHWASKNGNPTMVQKLLSAGAKARVAGDAHDTPLHSAAENSHEIVRLLIDAGADPDATLYQTRETPLHIAAKTGNVVAMKYLLDSYPDVRCLDASEETPLHYAAREGRVNAAKLLLEYGADAEARNAEGKTAADIAKLSKQTKITELFVRFDC